MWLASVAERDFRPEASTQMWLMGDRFKAALVPRLNVNHFNAPASVVAPLRIFVTSLD